MEGGWSVAVSHRRRLEAYRVLQPEPAPEYLKELFCSNLHALLEILDEEHSPARSGAYLRPLRGPQFQLLLAPARSPADNAIADGAASPASSLPDGTIRNDIR